jgi:hypothetical protein
MNPFKHHGDVETVIASGTLRVVVKPSPGWWSLLFQAGILVTFAVLCLRSWEQIPLLERILISGAVIAGIAGWFEQLFGFSEVIEFDQKSLRIRTETFGWERTREYPVEQCSDLQVQDLTGNPHGLQCRLGWKTIEFGDHLSEQQGIEVISALQDTLPEIASKLLPSVDVSKQFTRLGLS